MMLLLALMYSVTLSSCDALTLKAHTFPAAKQAMLSERFMNHFDDRL